MVLEEKVRDIYDDDWNEEDIGKYHELVNVGRTMIGKDIPPSNSFLVEMTARMTINQMKGKYSNLTNEEIDKIKRANKRAYSQLVHNTPPNEFYYSSNNPINWTDEELYDKTRVKPDEDDVIKEEDPDNYLVEQVNKMMEIN
jgi:hypothetical protein